jgi:hypothetical protein
MVVSCRMNSGNSTLVPLHEHRVFLTAEHLPNSLLPFDLGFLFHMKEISLPVFFFFVCLFVCLFCFVFLRQGFSV